MKTASLKEIKTELEILSPKALLEVCISLVKFKKENKELVSYLLFEAGNEAGYIINVKDSIDLMFADINRKNLYLVKKSLRKIIRTSNRFIKYSSVVTTEIEILIYVCEAIKDMKLNMQKSASLSNLYSGLIKKIEKALQLLHEDLQYDYLKELEKIRTP